MKDKKIGNLSAEELKEILNERIQEGLEKAIEDIMEKTLEEFGISNDELSVDVDIRHINIISSLPLGTCYVKVRKKKK